MTFTILSRNSKIVRRGISKKSRYPTCSLYQPHKMPPSPPDNCPTPPPFPPIPPSSFILLPLFRLSGLSTVNSGDLCKSLLLRYLLLEICQIIKYENSSH